MDALLKCFVESKKYEDSFHYENRSRRTAVAYDKAFNFYYKENLEALEELGEVIYFSPLKDEKLPENIDFLYIGGGYPEIFIKELSENISMLNSIKNALEAGLKCYAECGGLMYLSEEIEGYKTVGFFKGKASMSKKLQHFGYAEIEALAPNIFSKGGVKVNCHEFHKSFVELQEKTIFKTEQVSYDGEVTQWNCGYIKKNTLATYGHTWGRFITF
jgi:cobyrinic acid a,c-diamide synthase